MFFRSRKRRSRLAFGRVSRTRETVLKKRKAFMKRFFFISIIVGIIGIFVGLGYFLFYSNYFKIDKVLVIRDELVIASGIETHFSESFRDQNIFFFSESQVSTLLDEEGYFVKSFHIRRKLPETLEIELVSYPLVARTSWIGQDSYIDEGGFLVPAGDLDVSLLSYISLHILAPHENKGDAIVSQEGSMDDLQFGDVIEKTFTERVIYPEDLTKVLDIENTLRNEFSFDIVSTDYYRVAREAKYTTSFGTELLFDLQKSISNQIYKVRVVHQNRSLSDGSIGRLDLRIGSDMVFYQTF